MYFFFVIIYFFNPTIKRTKEANILCLDGELSDWKSSHAGQRLWSLNRALVLVEGTTDSTGLLVTKICWLVLLSLVELSQVLLLGLVDDGQNASDRFADLTAKMNKTRISLVEQQKVIIVYKSKVNLHLGDLGNIWSSNLWNSECQQFLSLSLELGFQLLSLLSSQFSSFDTLL